MFDGWKREYFIRKTLRRMTNQRVVGILQPGNVWVIEKALPDDEKNEGALRTCHMRGWVEPLEDAIPKGNLTPEGNLPDDNIFSQVGPFYRLTEAGWQAVHRTQTWVKATFAVAFATLLASILSLIIAARIAKAL